MRKRENKRRINGWILWGMNKEKKERKVTRTTSQQGIEWKRKTIRLSIKRKPGPHKIQENLEGVLDMDFKDTAAVSLAHIHSNTLSFYCFFFQILFLQNRREGERCSHEVASFLISSSLPQTHEFEDIHREIVWMEAVLEEMKVYTASFRVRRSFRFSYTHLWLTRDYGRNEYNLRTAGKEWKKEYWVRIVSRTDLEEFFSASPSSSSDAKTVSWFFCPSLVSVSCSFLSRHPVREADKPSLLNRTEQVEAGSKGSFSSSLGRQWSFRHHLSFEVSDHQQLLQVIWSPTTCLLFIQYVYTRTFLSPLQFETAITSCDWD